MRDNYIDNSKDPLSTWIKHSEGWVMQMPTADMMMIIQLPLMNNKNIRKNILQLVSNRINPSVSNLTCQRTCCQSCLVANPTAGKLQHQSCKNISNAPLNLENIEEKVENVEQKGRTRSLAIFSRLVDCSFGGCQFGDKLVGRLSRNGNLKHDEEYQSQSPFKQEYHISDEVQISSHYQPQKQFSKLEKDEEVLRCVTAWLTHVLNELQGKSPSAVNLPLIEDSKLQSLLKQISGFSHIPTTKLSAHSSIQGKPNFWQPLIAHSPQQQPCQKILEMQQIMQKMGSGKMLQSVSTISSEKNLQNDNHNFDDLLRMLFIQALQVEDRLIHEEVC